MADKLYSELHRGEWSNSNSYTIGDFVSHNGSSFTCIDNNTNQEPPNVTYWALIASGGGDVLGPASSTTNRIVLFDGTTGKLIKDGEKTITATLGSDDTTIPTSKAVKDVTDGKHPTMTKATASEVATGTNDTKYTTPLAVAPYANNYLFRQAIINGNFDVWQRGTTFTTPNDDTYIADRWNALVDGNGSWTFSQSTDVPLVNSIPSMSKYSLKCVNVTTNKQCGIVQILENIDAVKIIGKDVSLSFAAKTTTGKVISNLRASLLVWSGTADTVTSDVVGTWAGNGTNPTWASSWTAEVAGTNKSLTTDWQTFTIENVSLTAGATNNLAVVIWVDDTTITTGDEFYITQVQLCAGDVALPFMPKSYEEELRVCQRYYFQLTAQYMRIIGYSEGGIDVYLTFHTPQQMRISPIFAITGSRGTDWILRKEVDNSTNTTGTLSTGAMSYVETQLTLFIGSGTFTGGAIYTFIIYSTNCVLAFSSEL